MADTSKENIKMCEKALEVQEFWLNKENTECYGDVVARHRPDRSDDPYDIITISYDWGCPTNNYYIFNYYKCSLARGGDRITKIVWLPHQDQLWELIGDDCGCSVPWIHQIVRLDEFADYLQNYEEEQTWHNNDFVVTGTMEQVLLQMLMKKKYNKKWVVNDWVLI